MKKIFTLCAAFAAVTANAQKEVYVPWEGETHTLKAEWVANTDNTQPSTVSFGTDHIKAVAVSGPISKYNDGQTLPLTPKYDNAWTTGNNCGDANIYCVNGKGNPTTGVAFVEVRTDGTGTGTYRACYDTSNDPEGPYYAADGVTTIETPNFYYQPDGANGLPKNGVYYKFTPSTDGLLSVIGWIAKGNRKAFIVKESDAKALEPGTSVTYSGYINNGAYKDENGKFVYQESIPVNAENPYVPQAGIGNTNVVAWVYFTFEAKANETYWAFCQSTQFGLGGFEFTPGGSAGIRDITTDNASADNRIYNISGQQVSDSYRGIVIKNGKKFVK